MATTVDNLTLTRLGLPPGFTPDDPAALVKQFGMAPVAPSPAAANAPIIATIPLAQPVVPSSQTTASSVDNTATADLRSKLAAIGKQQQAAGPVNTIGGNGQASTSAPAPAPAPAPAAAPAPTPKMLSQNQQAATALGLPPGFTPDNLSDVQSQFANPPGKSSPTSIPTVTTQPIGKPGAGPDYTTLGLDPDYYERITGPLEGGGNPNAVNPKSGAAGSSQWLPAADWKPGQPWRPGPAAIEAGVINPFDPAQDRAGSFKFTQLNVQRLTQYLGRPPTSAEAYLAHQQGAEGAYKLLANPNAKASDIVGSDAVTGNGGTADMTAGEFAQMQENKYINANPNALGGTSTAAGAVSAVNQALAPYQGQTTFQGGRGAAGPGPMRTVTPPAYVRAFPDFMTGVAHTAIDVPLNTISQGVNWLGQQFPNLGTIGGVPILPTQAQQTAENARIAAYNRDWAANPASQSWGGWAGGMVGSLVPMALAMPEIGALEGLGAAPQLWRQMLGLGAKGALGGGILGLEQSSAGDEPLLEQIAKNAAYGTGLGAGLPIAARLLGAVGSRILPSLLERLPAGEAAIPGVPAPGEVPPAEPPGTPPPGAPPALPRVTTGTGVEPQIVPPREPLPAAPVIREAPPVAPQPGEPALPPSVRTPAPSGIPPAPPGVAPDLTPSGRAMVPVEPAPEAPRPMMPPAGDQAAQTAVRVADYKAIGVDDPTAGMRHQDPMAWQYERNLISQNVEKAQPIRAVYEKVQTALSNTLDRLAGKMGGSEAETVTTHDIGKATLEALQGKADEEQKVIGRIYKAVEKRVGPNFGAKPNQLLAAMDQAGRFAENDPIVESVQRQLAAKGIGDPTGNDRWLPNKGVTTKTALSVSDAEDLRKSIGQITATTPTQINAKTAIIHALDRDVIDTAGVDSFKQGRELAHARFEEFEPKLLRQALEHKAEPFKYVEKLLRENPEQLQAAKDAMLSGTPEQIARGTRAWNLIRSNVIKDLNRRAFGRDPVGHKLFNAGTYNSELERLTQEGKLGILFTPEEIATLQRVGRVGHWTFTGPDFAMPNWSRSGTYAGERMAAIGKALQMVPGLKEVGRVLAEHSAGVAQEAAIESSLHPDTAAAIAKKAQQDRAAAITNMILKLGRGARP